MNQSGATYDALILDHLNAASRDVELLVRRRFFPVTGMQASRWPPFHVAASWEVWTEDDLLSVSLLQVGASGINASPITITHYFLEPQEFGPPFNRVEVDLSSQDVFQAGPTPQRSVEITGQWGYCATTAPAGTLGAAISSTTATTITLTTPVTAHQGDVILVDSEAMYVDVSPALATVGTANVWRGVNGTTAATHLIGASVSAYRAPADVRRFVRAAAIQGWHQDMAQWGPIIGANGQAMQVTAPQIQAMRDALEANYARLRTAAV